MLTPLFSAVAVAALASFAMPSGAVTLADLQPSVLCDGAKKAPKEGKPAPSSPAPEANCDKSKSKGEGQPKPAPAPETPA